MAVFDVEQQRMCVRVVYDGAASAGKTTNLQQLAELFASQRTCELFSPAEMDGRTLYFDWLQIAAGMVCGFPLVCQVITVPGQLVLTPRRRHLLATADVVVHVCDSAEQAVTRALDGFALLDDVGRERGEPLPLVIQANKQDHPGAVSGAALLAALGSPSAPAVEAIASDGIGVIDTFVAAVRAAVRSIQARVERGKIRVAVRQAERADDALERVRAVEIDPEWAVEMMLEEASNVFSVGDSLGGTGGDEDREPPATWRPEHMVGSVPTFPTEHVPTGFIWPAHTGRAALRELAGEPVMRSTVALDGEGMVHIVLGDFVLSTRRERRFESDDAARHALVRAARERTQLGPLLAPETVLVAQPEGTGASWLWTILPRMPTVAQLAASRDRPASAQVEVLAAFGAALADALKVAASHGTAMRLSPRAFGVRNGSVRYIGELSSGENPSPDWGHAVSGALVELATLCEDVEPAVAALEAALTTKFSREELGRLARGATWSRAQIAPSALRSAHARIEEAFERGQRAA